MVDKISAIRFLIEDCYKNFPELIEEIPKEEMYKILENNISAIEVEEELEGSDGLYDTSERTISLASKDIDIGLEDIKKEQDIAHMKEYMLYLGKMKMILGIDRERKIVNIKGFVKFTKARYKSSKSILEHIIDLTKVKDDFEDNKCFGTALNEGITEWARLKTVSGNESYEMEINVVNQIENIIGAKKIIEIVNTKPEEMYKALNMSKSEFENFCNKIDYLEFINSLKEKIQDNLLKLNDGKQKLERFNKKEGKYINKEIKSTAIYIQNQLITKLIIPYFENNSDGSGIFEKVLNCKNLIKDYFRWIYIDREVFSEFTKTSEYKKLSNMLDKIIIQCIKKNQTNIEKWEKKKTFDFYRILLDSFNDSIYRTFMQKMWKRIEEIQLEEDANILEKVKREIENQDKIDVRLFTKDYKNEYTSWDINRKVSELILRRKLTDIQYRNLQSEIGIYNSCKQVISRKDIKRLKNKDGITIYYVLINGEEYADQYFKKLKFGRKFLSSRRYEIKEEQDKVQIDENVIDDSDNKVQNRIFNFIENLKLKILRKHNRTVNKEESKTNLEENKFKYNLIVDFNKANCQAVEKSSNKAIENFER